MLFSISKLSKILDISEENILNFQAHSEASVYNGCEFNFCKSKYIFREAKVTPKKTGLFVTFWKRNIELITEPFDACDKFDILLVLCRDSSNSGLFKFTKEALIDNGIVSSVGEKREGKRGFRLYPEWSQPVSAQALKTKKWQVGYFSRNLSLK